MNMHSFRDFRASVFISLWYIPSMVGFIIYSLHLGFITALVMFQMFLAARGTPTLGKVVTGTLTFVIQWSVKTLSWLLWLYGVVLLFCLFLTRDYREFSTILRGYIRLQAHKRKGIAVPV